jgi:hypothetical protein
VSKRKTAQGRPATKKEPESKRRWVVLNAKTNRPILGNDEGVSNEDKAHRLSESYLMETKVMLLHEWAGTQDPDEEDE